MRIVNRSLAAVQIVAIFSVWVLALVLGCGRPTGKCNPNDLVQIVPCGYDPAYNCYGCLGDLPICGYCPEYDPSAGQSGCSPVIRQVDDCCLEKSCQEEQDGA